MSKYTIKEDLDKYVYKTYNILSNILLSISKYKKITKLNLKFKNIYDGKRCFVLGTGPSLKKLNYNYLKDEVIFGVNYLYKSEIINHIEPQYYCLYDQSFHTTHKEDTIEIVNKLPNTTVFIRTKALDSIKSMNIKKNNIYFQHCNLFQYDDFISVDMAKNMTAPFNVVLGAIQTAIYMGFKEIYLLGCDFNSFASLKVEHCYDNGEAPDRTMTVGFELKYYSIACYHHYALDKYARKNNIRIYNLTPNSLLDAYECKNIEDIKKL